MRQIESHRSASPIQKSVQVFDYIGSNVFKYLTQVALNSGRYDGFLFYVII